jgi:hypothetical protein
MSDADLRRIETALGTTLPAVYREQMRNYPFRVCAGNADTDLWDNAESLITRNLELRTEWVRGFKPWPPHLFFIGDALSACAYLIDLRDPQAAVWWADHCDLTARSTGIVAPSFVEWAEQYFADLKHDLEVDGIDVNAEPSE